MTTEDDAQKAIDDLNGTEVGGRTLTVSEARPKVARGSGPGGGGGFGGGQSRRPREARW
jgi:RNA recognition motif-containing protein